MAPQLDAVVAFSDWDVKTGDSRGFARTFDEVIDLLEAVRLPYAVVGGLAVSAYRRPRMTEDIDVVVSPRHAMAFVEEARRRGFVVESLDPGHDPCPMYTWRHPETGVVTDLLVAESQLEEALVDEAVEGTVKGRRVSVASREMLVAMKLPSDRPRDETDIVEVLTDVPVNLADLRVRVHRYIPEQGGRLERLIAWAEEDKKKPRRKGRKRPPG